MPELPDGSAVKAPKVKGNGEAEEHAQSAELRLAELREDPDEIRRIFETGKYPTRRKSTASPTTNKRPSSRLSCSRSRSG